MGRLWTATLDRNSPRYHLWRDILQSDEVPITTTKLAEVQLGQEWANVYKLDLDRLEKPQMERLIAFITDQFDIRRSAAISELEHNGMPIHLKKVKYLRLICPHCRCSTMIAELPMRAADGDMCTDHPLFCGSCQQQFPDVYWYVVLTSI
jgi:hypothetical protein